MLQQRLAVVRVSCSEVAEATRADLLDRFPATELLDALSIVQPQAWLNEAEARQKLPARLKVIQAQYCEPKRLLRADGSEGDLVMPLLK